MAVPLPARRHRRVSRLRRVFANAQSVRANVLFPVEANSVFVELPAHVLDHLRERGWEVYTFIGNAARFMCSWDTTEEDIDRLAGDIRDLIATA